jgi:hypothetical protein
MINLKRLKILGAYLTVTCALQICLYLAMSTSAERYQWLFYFNPRFGLYFVESVIKGEPPPPGIFGWMSAACVLALGLLLLSGRPLKAYVISEVALSAPTLLFVFVVALANLSPAHGFSVGELFVPVCLMIIFSVVPLILAFWARSKAVVV